MREGMAGRLAVFEGDYWSSGPLSVLQVRLLAEPQGAFEAAVDTFLVKRKAATEA